MFFKNRKVLILLLINIFLAVVIWRIYAYNRMLSFTNTNYSYPVFLNKHGVIGTNKNWKLFIIQPVVVGFYSKNNHNYLIVKYPDQTNLREAAVFISGVVSEGSKIDKIAFENEAKEISILTFEQLKQKLGLKKQIKLHYLAETPLDFSENDSICQVVSEACQLGKLKLITEDLLKDDFNIFVRPEKIYFAVKISLNLEQK